ncbi:MAG: outer membrane beta-barrel protein [Desulfuromonadaceae bacterium]|nr:outer membrane beta-barrel protein [Desulfuromonadaceae bacterium]
MKHLQKNITGVLCLCLVMLLLVAPGSAEDFYRQLSLGGESLTMAPADVKDPEPGVITAKYGFRIARDFMPYVGTGVAYTFQPDLKTGDIAKIKTGVAAQLGFNYLLGTNTTLKLDYKYLSLSPEQQRGDSSTTPQSFGIGLDIKF